MWIIWNGIWGHGSRFGFSIDWSSDSKWIAYDKSLENNHAAVFVYNIDTKKSHQLTSGFYEDSSPTFSKDGKYIFFLSDRNFSALYSDMGDGTWVYPNSTQIAAISLQKKTSSLLETKNDEIKVVEEKKEETKESEEGDDKKEERKERKRRKTKNLKRIPLNF